MRRMRSGGGVNPAAAESTHQKSCNQFKSERPTKKPICKQIPIPSRSRSHPDPIPIPSRAIPVPFPYESSRCNFEKKNWLPAPYSIIINLDVQISQLWWFLINSFKQLQFWNLLVLFVRYYTIQTIFIERIIGIFQQIIEGKVVELFNYLENWCNWNRL